MREKGERVRVVSKGRKGEGRFLIQTESIYSNFKSVTDSHFLTTVIGTAFLCFWDFFYDFLKRNFHKIFKEYNTLYLSRINE